MARVILQPDAIHSDSAKLTFVFPAGVLSVQHTCESLAVPDLIKAQGRVIVGVFYGIHRLFDRRLHRMREAKAHSAMMIRVMGPHHDIVRTLREAHNAPLGKLLLKLGDCERDERFILQMTQLWIDRTSKR